MTGTAVANVAMTELERYADAFARSGLFGAKNKEQALSLLLLAHAEGVHPAIAMRDYDIINGRPAKKAEAMHRAFLAAGGKIEWHKLDDSIADATFSHPAGGTARITWDHARAMKAGIGGKDMYKKYPRQMLKARVVSEGCRTVFPAATSGLYVPEEVRLFEPKPQTEKNMGSAPVVDDEDITLQIKGEPQAPEVSAPQDSPSSSLPPAEAAFISVDQAIALEDELKAHGKDKAKLLANISRAYGIKIERLQQIRTEDYELAMEYARGA